MEGAGARSAILTKEDLPQGEVETEDRDRWRRWTKAPWTHEAAQPRSAVDILAAVVAQQSTAGPRSLAGRGRGGDDLDCAAAYG